MNGISFRLLMEYRNKNEFCVLILYSTQLNLFINSSGIPGAFWIQDHVIWINTISLLPFQTGCLLLLARPSNTVLNRSNETGHPGLVPGLGEETFSVSSIKYDVSHRCS